MARRNPPNKRVKCRFEFNVRKQCVSGLCQTSSQGLHTRTSSYVGKTGSKGTRPIPTILLRGIKM